MRVLKTHALCPRCGYLQTFVRLAPDYSTHILLCIVTAGLWLPVLAATALYNNFVLGWRCERCSRKL